MGGWGGKKENASFRNEAKFDCVFEISIDNILDNVTLDLKLVYTETCLSITNNNRMFKENRISDILNWAYLYRTIQNSI